MDTLTVIGFSVSLFLFGIELWRTFWRKAKLDVDMSWRYRSGELEGLEFTIFNIGHRKTAIAKVGIRCSDDASPTNFRGGSTDVRDRLPLVLDVDEITPRLFFPLRDYMTDGRAQGVLVTDHHGKQWFCELKPKPEPEDQVFDRD